MLYERQDPAAVAPLRRLLVEAVAPLPQTRIDALWSLQGLSALRDDDLIEGLGDRTPQVRAQALLLAEHRLEASPKLMEMALGLARDPDSRVRFQAAFSLGETKDPRARTALAQIVRRDGDNPWIRIAVLSSCGSSSHELFVELWKESRASTFAGGEVTRDEVLDQLVQVVGSRGRAEEITRVLNGLASGMATDPSRKLAQDRLLLGLGAGLRRSGRALPVGASLTGPGARMVAQRVGEASTTARDERASVAQRQQAIRLLAIVPPEVSHAILVELLDARQPQEIQIAAVNALADDGGQRVADLLIQRIPSFAPPVQSAVVQVLLSRGPWTRALLAAASKGEKAAAINPELIEPARRALLLKHGDPEIVRLAKTMFQQNAPRPRTQAIADYLQALQLKSDANRGRQVFSRECKACHKIGEIGVATGPDLTGSPSRDPAALLSNILDPNASVQPGYVQYVVSDQTGRTYTGIIASETGSSVTLRRGDGAQDVLLRNQIDAMTSTGQSLMPEGLEKTITKQEMADLIAFLRASHRGNDDSDAPDASRSPRLDIGTLPGLIEPDE